MRIDGGANLESYMVFRLLEQRQVKHGRWPLAEIVALHILHHPDDSEPACIAIKVRDAQMPTNRICIGEVFVRHALIDDDDFGLSGLISEPIISASQNRNLERREVIRANDVYADRSRFFDRRRPAALDPWSRRTVAACQRTVNGKAGGSDSRNSLDLAEQALIQGKDLFPFIAGHAGIDRKQQHILFVKARIQIFQILQAMDQQSGADHEHQRNGDL